MDGSYKAEGANTARGIRHRTASRFSNLQYENAILCNTSCCHRFRLRRRHGSTGDGSARVIGIDIRDDLVQSARTKALRAAFAISTHERADIIVSIDSFEHFADPGEVLRRMNALLRPAGEVLVSFGPTWYHPLGGHLFSVFPWAHLLFSERALIHWRSTFKTDGATRFSEVAGGLNQMTIAKFEKLVADSPFRFASLELVPIRKLRFLHNRCTREFTTACVRCRLVRKD